MNNEDIMLDEAQESAALITDLEQIIVHHSPMGIDYTIADIERMELSERAALEYMQSYGQPSRTLAEQREQEDMISRFKANFARDCMLFDDGMTASEVRETLGITHQTVLMLIEDGQIQRTLISHARGGKYSYDTQSVFAYLYHRKYGIDVFADDETILKQLLNNKKKKK
jgi:hypothetical protein